jgi:hypothetical protein
LLGLGGRVGGAYVVAVEGGEKHGCGWDGWMEGTWQESADLACLSVAARACPTTLLGPSMYSHNKNIKNG